MITIRNWGGGVRCAAITMLITFGSVAARAGVEVGATQLSVQSDARAEDGMSDPKSATSAGQLVEVSSSVGVATGSARGALLGQVITNGIRFGGNGGAETGANGDGRSALGQGQAVSTFNITTDTHDWSLTGQL